MPKLGLAAALAVVAAAACGGLGASCPEGLGELCGHASRRVDLEIHVVDGVRVDVDGDGDLEYALVSASDRRLVLVEADGRSRQLPLSRTPTRIAVAALDDDGDGRPDLMLSGLLMAAVSGSFVGVTWLRGDAVHCGDVDGDGIGDVIGVDHSAIFLMTSGDPT